MAAVDLSLARLVEGHADAVAILHELGAPDRATGAELGAELAGVWAAEPDRLVAEPAAGGWRLSGEKRWCSGGAAVDLALVTATAPDGPRLFLVRPTDLEPVPGSWQPLGMQDSDSQTMRFRAVAVAPADAIGGPGAYVGRPGFWHGGAGVAAVWWGGAAAVLEPLGRMAMGEPAHPDDLVALAHGRARRRLDAAAAVLREGAAAIDAAPHDGDGARLVALRTRSLVEDAARTVLAESAQARGAGPLCHDPGHQRRVADLIVYLGQQRADRGTAAFGRAAAADPAAL